VSVWPGRLARAGSGLLVLGAVVAVAGAGLLAPVPEDVVVVPELVPVPPGPTALVCPGPVVLPESRDDVDPEFNPAPVDSVDAARFAVGGSGGGPLDVWPLEGLDGAPVLRADPGGTRLAQTTPTGPLVARAEPVDDVAPLVAASVASAVAAGDLRGTTAAACQHPGSEHWLVGGGTQLGTTSLLLVHNPGATPAEIGLDVWGPAGKVDLGGAARYVVPSGGELSLRLSAFAPELARTVVRVTSAGGQIAAFLQVSELDGFTPGGTDLVVAGAAPAERQVVATLSVPASQIDGPGAGRLRLLALGAGEPAGDAPEEAGSAEADEARTGRETVRASVTFLGADGPVTLPGAETVELVPDEVVDVDLGGLPAGEYAVVVEAEQPVVAGTRVARIGSPAEPGDAAPVELAWTPATPLGDGGILALPAGLSATAVVAAVPESLSAPTGVRRGVLRAYDEAGAQVLAEDVLVTAGAALAVPLPSGAAAVELEVEAADDAVTGGAGLVWGVVGEAVAPDGAFVSTLSVPVRPAVVDTVAVREGQRLPLD